MQTSPDDPARSAADVAGLPSLVDPWSRRHDLAPMPWSLGVVADLLWNVFPCLRPAVRDLILEQIDSAISGGDLPRVNYRDETPSVDQLTLPEAYDYITQVLKPKVLDRVAEGSATAEMLVNVCKYLRLLLTFSGDSAATVKRYAEEIVEDIDTPRGRGAVLSVDPELVGYIQGRLKLWS